MLLPTITAGNKKTELNMGLILCLTKLGLAQCQKWWGTESEAGNFGKFSAAFVAWLCSGKKFGR